jgi:hypothetical protein
MFPQLTAAIADIAAFMDDDEGPNFDAAQQRAIDCYRDEMLPMVLGGEWSRGQPGMPWPDPYSLELFDHPIWFRRRNARGPRTWQDCAVLGSPYRREVADETGELALDFLVAAQPLLRQKVGIWTSGELSWWFPGQTICVLVAAGLEPDRASGFGFRPVRKGIAGVQDFALVCMAPAGAVLTGGETSIQAGRFRRTAQLQAASAGRRNSSRCAARIASIKVALVRSESLANAASTRS